MRKGNRRGFTLLEILVALAVIAIGLGAAMGTAGAGVDQAVDLRNRQLAGWVARNTLETFRARIALPPSPHEERTGEATMGDIPFVWRATMTPTDAGGVARMHVEAWPEGTQTPLGSATGFLVTTAEGEDDAPHP